MNRVILRGFRFREWTVVRLVWRDDGPDRGQQRHADILQTLLLHKNVDWEVLKERLYFDLEAREQQLQAMSWAARIR
jgi:hypothetical protein